MGFLDFLFGTPSANPADTNGPEGTVLSRSSVANAQYAQQSKLEEQAQQKARDVVSTTVQAPAQLVKKGASLITPVLKNPVSAAGKAYTATHSGLVDVLKGVAQSALNMGSMAQPISNQLLKGVTGAKDIQKRTEDFLGLNNVTYPIAKTIGGEIIPFVVGTGAAGVAAKYIPTIAKYAPVVGKALSSPVGKGAYEMTAWTAGSDAAKGEVPTFADIAIGAGIGGVLGKVASKVIPQVPPVIKESNTIMTPAVKKSMDKIAQAGEPITSPILTPSVESIAKPLGNPLEQQTIVKLMNQYPEIKDALEPALAKGVEPIRKVVASISKMGDDELLAYENALKLQTLKAPAPDNPVTAEMVSDGLQWQRGAISAQRLINAKNAGDINAVRAQALDLATNVTDAARVMRAQQELIKKSPELYAEVFSLKIQSRSGKELSTIEKNKIEQAAKIASSKANDYDHALNIFNANPTQENMVLRDTALEKLKIAEASLDLAEHSATPRNILTSMAGSIGGGLMGLTSVATNVSTVPAFALGRGTAVGLGEGLSRLGQSARALITGSNIDKRVAMDPRVITDAMKAYATSWMQVPRAIKSGASISPAEAFQLPRPINTIEDTKNLGKHMLSWFNIGGGAPARFSKTVNGKTVEYNTFHDLATRLYESTLGVPSQVAYRLMNATDLPAFNGYKTASLSSQGRLLGLSGAKLKEWMKNPPEDALRQALDTANRYTFRSDNVAAQTLESIKRTNPVVHFITSTISPFSKTPTNIIGGNLLFQEPTLAAMGAIYHFSNGNKKLANEYLGIMLTGAALRYTIASMVDAGIATGPYDRKNAALREQQGLMSPQLSVNASALKRWRNIMLNNIGIGTYTSDELDPSPRSGDTWTSVRSHPIIGGALASAAEYAQARQNGEFNESDKILSLITPQLMSDIASMSDLPAMLSLSKILDAFVSADENKTEAVGGQLLATASAAFYPALAQQVVRAYQNDSGFNYIPETSGKGSVEFGLPFTDKNISLPRKLITPTIERLTGNTYLNPKITLEGQVIPRTPEGYNPYIYNILNSLKPRPVDVSATTQALDRLYKLTKDPSILRSVVDNKVQIIPGANITLNDRDHMLLKQYVSQERLRLQNNVVTSPEFVDILQALEIPSGNPGSMTPEQKRLQLEYLSKFMDTVENLGIKAGEMQFMSNSSDMITKAFQSDAVKSMTAEIQSRLDKKDIDGARIIFTKLNQDNPVLGAIEKRSIKKHWGIDF